MDFQALTDKLTFADVGPVVLNAAAAMVGIYVVVRGVRFIIDMLSGNYARVSREDWENSTPDSEWKTESGMTGSEYYAAHHMDEDQGPRSEEEWERTRDKSL